MKLGEVVHRLRCCFNSTNTVPGVLYWNTSVLIAFDAFLHIINQFEDAWWLDLVLSIAVVQCNAQVISLLVVLWSYQHCLGSSACASANPQPSADAFVDSTPRKHEKLGSADKYYQNIHQKHWGSVFWKHRSDSTPVTPLLARILFCLTACTFQGYSGSTSWISVSWGAIFSSAHKNKKVIASGTQTKMWDLKNMTICACGSHNPTHI